MRHIKYKKQFVLLSALLILISSLLVPLIRFWQGNPLNIAGSNYVFLQFVNSHSNILPLFFASSWFNIILSSLLLLGSLYLFSELSSNFSRKETEYYISMILFVTLPALILTHTGLTEFSLLFFLILLFMYSYQNNKYLFFATAFVLSLFAPLITLAFLVYMLLNKTKESNFILQYILSIFLSMIFALIINASFFKVHFEIPVVKSLFTFFGSNSGYSIIILLFGLIGTYTFEEFNKNKLLLLMFYMLLISSFFNAYLRIVAIIIMTFLSANALDNLLEKQWTHEILKYAVTLLICCMLFFSLITSISHNIDISPSQEHAKALTYLKNVKSDYNEGYLLTDDDYYSFIEYYSGVKPYYGEDKSHEIIANNIFYSRKNQDVVNWVSDANISFILVDSHMTSGNVWANDREDLMFVLENSINFHKIYNGMGVKLYYFDAKEE